MKNLIYITILGALFSSTCFAKQTITCDGGELKISFNEKESPLSVEGSWLNDKGLDFRGKLTMIRLTSTGRALKFAKEGAFEESFLKVDGDILGQEVESFPGKYSAFSGTGSSADDVEVECRSEIE